MALTILSETFGTGGDFPSFTVWKATRTGNLPALDARYRALALNQLHDGENFTLTGATTDAARYRELTYATGARTTGQRNVGAKMGKFCAIQENYGRVTGLQFNHDTNDHLRIDNLGARVDGCAFFDGSGQSRNGVTLSPGISDVRVRNCLMANMLNGYVTAGVMGSDQRIQNSTAANCAAKGFVLGNSTIAENCDGFSNATGDFDGTGDTGTQKNRSKDASAPGTGSTTGLVPATEFVSGTNGSEDLHHKTTSTGIDNGADLTADGVTADLDGNPRPQGTGHDRGPFEFAAAPTLALAVESLCSLILEIDGLAAGA